MAVALWAVGSTLARPRYPAARPGRDVEILRDEFGVPHVFAADRSDLFFGQGYATAADRIFQMDWSRRRLLGQTAEVLGRTRIVEDFRSRALGMDAVAESLYHRLPGEERAAVDAYAAGVNEWLRTHPLPAEFRAHGFRPAPWKPRDCLIVFRGLALTLTDLTDDLTASVGEEDALLGSNAWAVGPARSAGGAPILASDPHLEHSRPGAFTRAGLCDSAAAAIGCAVPGVPGLVLGRNRDLAWAPTAFEGDLADVFRYPRSADGRSWVNAAGRPHPIRRRRPLVWLRLAGPIAIPVFWQPIAGTELGPILKETKEEIELLRWAGGEPLPDEGMVTIHTIDARNLADIEGALAGLGVPDINLVVATADGHIARYVGGRIPRRVAHTGPRDGRDAALDWNGFVPFDRLPRIVNPPEGFVVSSNGPPPDNGEYLGKGWPELREKRLAALLAAADSMTIESARRIQRDHVVQGLTDEVAARISRLDRATLSPMAAGAVSRLQSWDGRAEIESVEPSIFRAWSAMGEDQAALERACDWLARRLGPRPEEWRWGRIHQALLKHPFGAIDSTLNVGPFARAGDRGTPDVAGYSRFDSAATVPALVRHGPATRFIADLGPAGASRGVLLPGEAGDPASPHALDQLDLWQRGELPLLTPPGQRPVRVTERETLVGQRPPAR